MSFLLKLALTSFFFFSPVPNDMVIWSSRNMVTLARTDKWWVVLILEKIMEDFKGKDRAMSSQHPVLGLECIQQQ